MSLSTVTFSRCLLYFFTVVTSHTWSVREGNVFSLSVHRGGGPVPWSLGLDREPPPPPYLGLDRGTPHQTWDWTGGSSPLDLGLDRGTLPTRPVPGQGPHHTWDWTGGPPPPPTRTAWAVRHGRYTSGSLAGGLSCLKLPMYYSPCVATAPRQISI